MSDDELLGLLVDAREGDRRRAANRILDKLLRPRPDSKASAARDSDYVYVYFGHGPVIRLVYSAAIDLAAAVLQALAHHDQTEDQE